MDAKVWILMGLVFLAACEISDNNGSIFEEKIYRGKQGMVLEVLPGTPPERVFENDEFQVSVQLTNKGPYPVNGLLLVTPEKDYLQVDGSSRKDIQLEGKDVRNTANDFRNEYFIVKAGKLDEQSETHLSTILITTCYDYKARAFPNICIDSDPYNNRHIEKPCSVEPISLTEGQGGPVVIDKVEQRMLIDKDYIRPQFTIYIENAGSGSVTAPGQQEKFCSSGKVVRNDYNIIQLSKISFSGFSKTDFSCNPEPFRLTEKNNFIICTLHSGLIPKSKDPFGTVLEIELDYGYTQTLAKEVAIERLPSI